MMKQTSSMMDVLYAANDAYVPHLAASVCSFCENNQQEQAIRFHILSLGINQDNRNRLTQMLQRYRRQVCFYELGNVLERIRFSVDTRGFDESVLARLFVGSVLPKEVQRVLYLDCDTIVTDSLHELFQTDLGDCLLGAVGEPTVTKSRRALLGMDSKTVYVNSGVLLFNLALWREKNAEKTVLDFYCSKGGNLTAPDQDAINGALAGKIKELSPRYNYGTIEIYYPYRTLKKISYPVPFVSQECYNAAKSRPAIIHYLGEERPWREGTTHPFTEEYEKYLAMTPWRGTPKEKGWKSYFVCFRIFNAVTRPVPYLRYKMIDMLIPAFMRYRAKHREKSCEIKRRQITEIHEVSQ